MDEAEAMGAESVSFDKPVRVYVDSFLGWHAVAKVPTGTYHRTEAHWVPVETGVVLDVMEVSSGMALVDVTGDAKPESEAELSDWGIDA